MEFAQIYDPVSPTGISLDENDRFLVGDKISDDTYEVIDTLGHDESTENENDKWVAKIEVVTPTRHQGLNPFFRTLTPLYREGNESYPYLASMSGTEIPWTPATAARVSHSLKTLVDNGPFICLVTEAMDGPLKDYVLDSIDRHDLKFDLGPIAQRLIDIVVKVQQEGMVTHNLTVGSFMVAKNPSYLFRYHRLAEGIRLFDLSKVDIASSTHEPNHLEEIRAGYFSLVLIVAVLAVQVQARLDRTEAVDISPWTEHKTAIEVFRMSMDESNNLEQTDFYERLPKKVSSKIRDALNRCYSLTATDPDVSQIQALLGELILRKKRPSRKEVGEQRQRAKDYMERERPAKRKHTPKPKKRPSRQETSDEQRQRAKDYMERKRPAKRKHTPKP